MLVLLLALACAPADTAALDTAVGDAWRPIVAGNGAGDPSCASSDKGPCYDCVEVSTNWYVRWTLGDDGEWITQDQGTVKTVTAGDGPCVAIDLGASIPE